MKIYEMWHSLSTKNHLEDLEHQVLAIDVCFAEDQRMGIRISNDNKTTS